MADRVLLTGISGFIAKHVALILLDAGYVVRGTVRTRTKAEETRDTLRQHGADVSRLEFAEADLLGDAGWNEAVEGCRFVVHTASPFPATQSRDRFALVPVARGGTLRVIEAAKRSRVERIVLTSSVVAIYYGHEDRSKGVFGEADWSNVEARSISDYAISKTVAERAAWDAVRAGGDGEGSAVVSPELAVVNPAFVLGPLLDRDAGTSARLVATMMKGRLPAVPDISFGIVDVRDVALAHLRAMEVTEAAGRRFVLTGGSRSMLEIGSSVAVADPTVAGRVPRFALPDRLVRFAALLSSQARSAVPELGREKRLDAGPAERILGLSFRTPDEAIGAVVRSLRETGLVR